MRKLDNLLRDWGFKLSGEEVKSAYPSSTTLARCIELGANGAAIRGKAGYNGYWPNSELMEVNSAVCNLPVDQRNVVLAKHVLCKGTFKEVAKECKCSTSTAWRKYFDAERSLKKTLKCW